MGRPSLTLVFRPSPILPSWASHARSSEDPSQNLSAPLPWSQGRGSHLLTSLRAEAAPWWLRWEHPHTGIRPASLHLASPSRPQPTTTPSSHLLGDLSLFQQVRLGALPPCRAPTTSPGDGTQPFLSFPRQSWVLGS